MKHLLHELLARRDLPREAMERAFDAIMSGEMTPIQTAALVTALRMKGEATDELIGAAASMRRHAILIDSGGMAVVDTCGTGGDSRQTFNISTAAALVVAGAGVPVAKHGNRAVTSQCGSADVLAALGVKIEMPSEAVEECLRTIGLGFLYAPSLHPAMFRAAAVRRELSIRTIFNMLGPLTNPAGARGQILGVFDPALTEPFAQVLHALGSRRAFVVHGLDGLDEITVTTTTRVTELKDGRVRTYEFDPLEYIGDYHSSQSLAGGDPAFNAKIIRNILDGEPGACRDITLLNAAAGIVAGGKADNFRDGFSLAQGALDSGQAAAKLQALVDFY